MAYAYKTPELTILNHITDNDLYLAQTRYFMGLYKALRDGKTFDMGYTSLSDSPENNAFITECAVWAGELAETARQEGDEATAAILATMAPMFTAELQLRQQAAPKKAAPKKAAPKAAPVVGGKEWSREVILDLFETNQKALERAIVRLYSYQTADEQASQTTSEHNGMGFNGIDAGIMSSFAEQIIKGRTLSEKQLAIARKKMRKYAGQIVRHIAENAASN